MTMYSALIYPETPDGGTYTMPEVPVTFVKPFTMSVSWNPYSTNPLDRTEYWEDTEGTLTLEQAQAASTSNASGQYNKEKAKALLLLSDWTELPSVTDSSLDPLHLTNLAEFITYRNTLRAIAVTKPTGTVAFPVYPLRVWAQ